MMMNRHSRSSRPRKSKPRSSGRSKTLSKNKVVIRRLPPLLPESQFLESIKQWVNENTTDQFKFYPGRVSKSKNKECIYSRAYIHFKNIEQILEFHRVYDNHLFRDKQGNENKAVVEFAIYQKLPKETEKPDPKQGTIETDPDYIAFLETIKAEEAQQNAFKEPSATLEGGATQLERLENRLASAAANAALNASEKPKTTPLIEYLRAQKSGTKSKSLSITSSTSKISSILSPANPHSSSSSQTTSKSVIKPAQPSRTAQAIEAAAAANNNNNNSSKYSSKKDHDKRKFDRERDRERERERFREKDRRIRERERERNRERERERERERNREREREREREKVREREKEKEGRDEKNKETVKDNNNSDQKIDKIGDDAAATTKAETDESKEKEPIRNSAVKITIQQRQKDQIRQIIQRPVKKEDKEPTIETKVLNNSFDNNNNNNFKVKENTSETKKNETSNKEITSTNSSIRSSTTSYSQSSNSSYSSHRNRRDKRRNYSFDNKPHHGQIQILTKPQSQQQKAAINTSNATTDSSTVSSSPAPSSTAKTSATSSSTSQENSKNDNNNNDTKAEHSNNVPPPINRRGRGYYSRRGRW